MKFLMEQWRGYLKEGDSVEEKLVPHFWKNGRWAYEMAEDTGNVELAQQFKTILDKVKEHIANIDAMVVAATESPDEWIIDPKGNSIGLETIHDELDAILKSGHILFEELDVKWYDWRDFDGLFEQNEVGAHPAYDYPLYLPGSAEAKEDPWAAKEAKLAYDNVKKWAGVR